MHVMMQKQLRLFSLCILNYNLLKYYPNINIPSNMNIDFGYTKDLTC